LSKVSEFMHFSYRCTKYHQSWWKFDEVLTDSYFAEFFSDPMQS